MNCVKVLLSHFEANFGLTPFFIKNFEVVFSCGTRRLCSKFTVMEDLFDPPSRVRGMKKLDKTAFKKTINVSSVTCEISHLKQAQKVLKNVLLKIVNMKPIQKLDDNNFKILIDPKIISSWNNFEKNTQEELESLNIREDSFSQVSVDLGFENWKAESAVKAILPKDILFTSFSVIGHIIHLNIKEELLDYKHVIAEILLDKIPCCKTVICKRNIINNVYRNFEMELLCGEPNFFASVWENQNHFEFDFSKVYWNPRLSTEHQRIVNEISAKDILFDVFAGVGPFAIPAAKKQCVVFANDLNPESYKWLKHNITLNKRAKDFIFTFNKDGKDFILEDVKEKLIETWKNDVFYYKIHVVMNLPAAAPNFIKYFNKLIKKSSLDNTDIDRVKKCLPIINCYFFVKDNECQKTVFEEASLLDLNNIKHSFHFIRKVSTGKSMTRVTFSLPYEYLVDEDEVDNVVEPDEPLAKRICTK